MNITKLRTNHFENPLGYTLDGLSFSWVTENSTGSFQKFAQVQISLSEDFSVLLYDSGKRLTSDSLDFRVDIALTPRTRYFWRVMIWDDLGEESPWSETAYFETARYGENWNAKWIGM